MTTLPVSAPPRPVRNGSRNGSPPPSPTCPVCAAPLPSARARYCSAACRQHTFRLRHPLPGPAAQAAYTDLPALRRALQRPRALLAHTVYECPRCEARFVGEQRCPECHVFCRALGPGGQCPDCDQPILLAELLGTEVMPSCPDALRHGGGALVNRRGGDHLLLHSAHHTHTA